jgi:hypothetical protein
VTTPGATTGGNSDGNNGGTTQTPQKIPLTADMVRIVDPPNGSRDDTGEAKYTVDNDNSTAWETQRFKQSKFGNNKPGMGVLINLGRPRNVSDVQVETSAPGVAMDLRWGTTDPGDNSAGDDKIVKTYKLLTDDNGKTDGTNQVFTVSSDQQFQYLLVFLTDLPPADDGNGGFKVSVTKIQVDGF